MASKKDLEELYSRARHKRDEVSLATVCDEATKHIMSIIHKQNMGHLFSDPGAEEHDRVSHVMGKVKEQWLEKDLTQFWKFTTYSEFFSYTFRAVERKGIDGRRKRRPDYKGSDLPDQADTDNPERDAIRREEQQRIKLICEDLVKEGVVTEQEMEIVQGRESDGLSITQIMEKWGITEKRVVSDTLYRIRKIVKEELKRRLNKDTDGNDRPSGDHDPGDDDSRDDETSGDDSTP